MHTLFIILFLIVKILCWIPVVIAGAAVVGAIVFFVLLCIFPLWEGDWWK